MKLDIQFLTQSPKTGVYGYRRRIPKAQAHLFNNKREYVKSFKTKNLAVAKVELDRVSRWFDDRIATLGYTRKGRAKLPSRQVQEIVDDMKRMGEHPSDLPKLDMHSDPNVLSEFVHDVLYAQHLKELFSADKMSVTEYQQKLSEVSGNTVWRLKEAQLRRDLLLDEIRRKYTDTDKLRADSLNPDINCDADNYIPPQRRWNEADPSVIRYRIMCGENPTPKPTWANAVEEYKEAYLTDPKKRNAEQVAKHIKAVDNLCIRFSAFLADGMDTPLEEIDVPHVNDFTQSTKHLPATKAKNLTILRAVWNKWNARNPKRSIPGDDPFKEAHKVHKKAIKATSVPRRPLTSEEFALFLASIDKETDAEIRIIGKIMAYCGAPTIEAAKLQRRDIKLQASVPHIVFRSTTDSITGKDRLDRAVPLLEPLYSEIKSYLTHHYDATSSNLFPKTGYGNHSSSMRSKRINSHITNKNMNDERLLSPYSLRHTFKDRAEAAGIKTDLREYLMGHKSEGSSSIHQKYGTNPPPNLHVAAMEKIQKAQNFGYVEEHDT